MARFEGITAEQRGISTTEDGALVYETYRRFIGYNLFGEHPETMIEFFDKHMR